MKLRIEGGARVDGSSVRDEAVEADGQTVIVSDGPVAVVIDPDDTEGR